MDDVVELEGVVRLRETLQVQRVVLQQSARGSVEEIRALLPPAPARSRDRDFGIWSEGAGWERWS